MNPLDICLGLLILFVACWECARGFGCAVLDALALYIVLIVAGGLTQPVAVMVRGALGSGPAHAFAFLLCFVLLGGPALLLSRLVQYTTQISAGMLDRTLAAAAGVGVALIVAHAVVLGVHLSSAGQNKPSAISGSLIAEQALNFDAYHSLLESAAVAAGGQRTASAN